MSEFTAAAAAWLAAHNGTELRPLSFRGALSALAPFATDWAYLEQRGVGDVVRLADAGELSIMRTLPTWNGVLSRLGM